MGAHNVWVYCFESGELLCMPTAQRSQCRYFAYQLWGEKERERGDGLFRFTERQGQGAAVVENRRHFLPSHGGANRILTQAARHRDKLTLHITGLDLINCVPPPPTKLRCGARNIMSAQAEKKAAASYKH